MSSQERVLDLLADALVYVDEALKTLKMDSAPDVRCLEADVQRLYDDVNNLMTRMCD